MNALIQLSLVHQCVHRLCVLCKSLNRYGLPHVPCSYKRMHAHTETLCRAVCLDSTAWCWALHEHAYTSVSMFRERAREREREGVSCCTCAKITNPRHGLYIGCRDCCHCFASNSCKMRGIEHQVEHSCHATEYGCVCNWGFGGVRGLRYIGTKRWCILPIG